MPIFISLKCFAYNRCIYLLSINFSYKQVNSLSKYQKKHFLLRHLENVFIKSLYLPLNFLLIDFKLYVKSTYFSYTIL